MWYNASATITSIKEAQKKILSCRLNMSMDRTVVTNIAHEIKNSLVMLLPCLKMADIMRPLTA